MKVYYNKSCSICRAEINLYKRQNIKDIEWVDITNNLIAEKDINEQLYDLIKSIFKDKSLIKNMLTNQSQYSDKNIFKNINTHIEKIINEKN